MLSLDVQTMEETKTLGGDGEGTPSVSQQQSQVQDKEKLTASEMMALIDKGRAMAERLETGFMVTSSKTGHNVQLAFEELTRMILIQKGQLVADDLLTSKSSSSVYDRREARNSTRLSQTKSSNQPQKRTCCSK